MSTLSSSSLLRVVRHRLLTDLIPDIAKKANRNRQSIVIPDEESGSTHMNGSAEGDAGKPCLSRGRLQATPAAFQAYGHWARPVFKYHQDPEAEEDAGIGDPRRYWGVIVDNACKYSFF